MKSNWGLVLKLSTFWFRIKPAFLDASQAWLKHFLSKKCLEWKLHRKMKHICGQYTFSGSWMIFNVNKTQWVVCGCVVYMHVYAGVLLLDKYLILILSQMFSDEMDLIYFVRKECFWRTCMMFLTYNRKTWGQRSRLWWQEFAQKSAKYCLQQFSVASRYKHHLCFTKVTDKN
jgi:hypothetical protein